MANPTEKLGAVVMPLLAQTELNIVNKLVAVNTETLVAINALSAKLDVLEKMFDKQKRPLKVAKAAPSQETVEQAITNGVATNNDKFPTNKRNYFIQRFKNDEAFRNKYYTDDIKTVAEVDPSINKPGAKDASKMHNRAAFTYKYLGEKKPTIIEEVDKEYKQATAAFEAKNKQPQQTVDTGAAS